MSQPELATSETEFLDGFVYRQDYEGLPRFYLVRIHPWEPRECPQYPHLYTPRVRVEVTLEGDPTAWEPQICDDDPESRNEAVRNCISAVEAACVDEWEVEQEKDRRERDADYWRSR